MTLTISRPLAVPVIANASRAHAQKGVFLQLDLQASNSPTRFFASGLPAGLSLVENTGIVYGTPTAYGTFNTSVWASNADGEGPAQSLTFEITPPPAAPLISLSSSAATARVGEVFSFNVTASNSPTSFAATNLPSGLSINPTDGVIAGTPTQAGTYEIILTASNAGGTSSPQALVLTVNAPPSTPEITTSSSLPRGRVGTAYSANIVASEPPISGIGSSTTLPAGLSVTAPNNGFSSGSFVLSGTPSASGTFTFVLSASNNVGQGQGKSFTLIIDPAVTAPVITSAATSTVTQATPMIYQITASNSPTNYAATGLPDGLILDPLSGLISGSAVNSGTSRVSITAGNAAGTSTPLSLALTVKALATVPRIITASYLYPVEGQAFTLQLEATDLPTTRPLADGYSFSATNLPSGASINSATGVISFPALSKKWAYYRDYYGYYQSYEDPHKIYVSALNPAGVGPSQTIYIYPNTQVANYTPIIMGPSSLSGVYGQPTSITVQSNRTLTGGSRISVYETNGYQYDAVGDAETINYTPYFTGRGTYRLSGTNKAGPYGWSGYYNYYTGYLNNLPITVQAASGAPSLTIPVSVSARQSQAFSLELKSSQADCRVWSLIATPSFPAGLTVMTSGASYFLSGTPTEPGNYKITFVTEQTAGSKLRSMPTDLILAVQTAAVPVAPAPLMFSSAKPSMLSESDIIPLDAAFALSSSAQVTGAVGIALDHNITTDGSPSRFDVSGLPPGLAVNENTGQITGEPVSPGLFTVTVVPYDDLVAGMPFELEFNIAAASGSPVVTSLSAAGGQVGAEFSYQIAASNSPENFAVGSLPDFLILNGQTGLISGTPSRPGVYTLQVSASNENGEGESMPLALTVAAASGTPVVTSSASATTQAGQVFSTTLTTSPAATFYGSTELPLGLSLDSDTGIISGTTTEPGTYTPEVWGVNAAGEGAHQIFTITVQSNPGVPTITGPGNTAMNPGDSFSIQLVATNSPTSFNAPPLPEWVSFDPYTGVLAGTATATGSYPLVFSANNASGTGSNFTSTLIFAVPAAFADWANEWFSVEELANPAIGGLGSDPNHNGMSNLLEYALAGDPVGGTTGVGILPKSGTSMDGRLKITFTRYLDRSDLTLIVQGADNLAGPWSDVATSSIGGAFVPSARASETGSGNARSVSVTDLYQLGDFAHPKRFLRLKVVK
jgi:hypothetical protein